MYIRIDMVKVFKLCQQRRRMVTSMFEKLLHSQRVSLQHVDSQNGHRKGGCSSALQSLVVHIKDSLPLGLNSVNHQDSLCPLRKL